MVCYSLNNNLVLYRLMNMT